MATKESTKKEIAAQRKAKSYLHKTLTDSRGRTFKVTEIVLGDSKGREYRGLIIREDGIEDDYAVSGPIFEAIWVKQEPPAEFKA